MKEDKIKIELTKEEAELFKRFREYQNIWAEIFKIRSGKAVLYFNEEGDLMQAHTDKTIFKRKKLDKCP